MKRVLREIGGLWLFYVLIFQLFKLVFIGWYHSDIGALWSAGFAALWHGLSMDMCVAGYATALPALLSIAALWVRGRWIEILRSIVLAVIAIVIAIVFVVDLRLYAFWNIRLDTTPIFYLMSSPTAAFASVSVWELLAGLVAIILLSSLIYLVSVRINVSEAQSDAHNASLKTRWFASCEGLVLLALLFVAIRGGLTVSTMNPGRAYFSDNARLNHAALNPLFTLLHSATHTARYGTQYQFFDAAVLDAKMQYFESLPVDTIPAFSVSAPDCDVYLVVLESFSAHLMPSLGGEPVAMRLDSIANRGLLFTNAYAGSFRTDRALPAILNGVPPQPSMSLMKYADKTERIPALAQKFRNAGFETSYYYGGDINFTNMKSLLVNGGFQHITGDKDFPLAQRISKWGAPDGAVFDKALRDIIMNTADAPRFMVVQTSSSHEPFDVPYENAAFCSEPRLNAFAYADSCAASFVLRADSVALSRGRKSLFVLVPDHWGCWPEGLDEALARHHIPVIFYGSALNTQGVRIDRLMSQHDLAATLLSLMGMEHDDFGFSRDMTQPTPAYAIISEPHLMGLISRSDTIIYDPDADRIIRGCEGPALDALKAYFQNLYVSLDEI